MMLKIIRSVFVALMFLPAVVLARLPAVEPIVRYMALGDSIAAGYKALPATSGYAYQLYLDRAFGNITMVFFDNASVPGATSSDLLNYQLPQVPRFDPNVVTISIGGNDLLALRQSANPRGELVPVLTIFSANLRASLTLLCQGMDAGGRIFIHNLYEIPQIPLSVEAVPVFNAFLATTVADVAKTQPCWDKALAVADVYNAFLGKHGLLLIERYLKRGIAVLEVHPTNKGHRVIEDTFRALIGR